MGVKQPNIYEKNLVQLKPTKCVNDIVDACTTLIIAGRKIMSQQSLMLPGMAKRNLSWQFNYISSVATSQKNYTSDEKNLWVKTQ